MSIKTVFILIIGIILAIVIAVGIGMYMTIQKSKVASVHSFESCVAAGYPIMESYPEQCKVPDGRTFVREITPVQTNFNTPISLKLYEHATFSDGLLVTFTSISDSRCKPNVQCVWAGELAYLLHITGGSMGQTNTQISLSSNRKKITNNGYEFSLGDSTETSIVITVTKGVVAAECYVSGCSSQVCSDQKNVVTTCEYRKEYACYKTAACERQANGQCGWTQTPLLTACLQKNS